MANCPEQHSQSDPANAKIDTPYRCAAQPFRTIYHKVRLMRQQLLEARCNDIHIRIGTGRHVNADERQLDHHEIAAPGLHASAILSYTNMRGQPEKIRVSDRHISVIPAGHAHSAEWTPDARFTSITVQPAFLRELASSNGLKDFAIAPQYASVDPSDYPQFACILLPVLLTFFT